jgi:hypothetical protein
MKRLSVLSLATAVLAISSAAQDNTLLSSVSLLTNGVTTKRVSSWDKTGGNADDVELKPGETLVLADITGEGSIKHFWMTLGIFSGTGSVNTTRGILCR